MSTAPVALRLDPTTQAITLTTTRPIEKDQIVLAISESLLLTASALPPPLHAAAEAAGLDPLGRLALRLLAEAAAAAGAWLPYLRVLPRREEMDLPMLWDYDEDDWAVPSLLPLLSSPLYDDVMESREAMRGELAALCHEVAASGQEYGVLRLLDWHHWTWARAIAMSRPYILVRSTHSLLEEEVKRLQVSLLPFFLQTA